MTKRAWMTMTLVAVAGCQGGGDRPVAAAHAGACVPDSLTLGTGDSLTVSSQMAIYTAVLDSLHNEYGNTVLYLDPRVETVGRDLQQTRLHETVLLDHLFESDRFADWCQADDASRCDVAEPGVSVRFSGLLRVKGTDQVLVDMTQQTVRPAADSSDWYFWATWRRFWVAREGRCFLVREVETKGVV